MCIDSFISILMYRLLALNQPAITQPSPGAAPIDSTRCSGRIAGSAGVNRPPTDGRFRLLSPKPILGGRKKGRRKTGGGGGERGGGGSNIESVGKGTKKINKLKQYHETIDGRLSTRSMATASEFSSCFCFCLYMDLGTI